MRREFEKLGLTIGGIDFGHFTGVVRFDETGSPNIIDVEASNFAGSPLRLGVEELVRERSALRRKWGPGFLDNGRFEIREHVRKWSLFQGLSECIEARFKDDIKVYLAAVHGPSRYWDVA